MERCFTTNFLEKEMIYLHVYNKRRRMLKTSKDIPETPMEEEVVLHKAEKPWMPMAKGDTGDGSAEDAQATELYRKFQGILNKLTPQKFQALAEQALKLEINTEERLSRCIDKIFTTALEEPSFSIAYANLCKVMSPIKVKYQSEDGKAKQTNFRRMLLTKCQKEFEKGNMDDKSRESMQREIDNAETDAKRAALKEELEFAFTKSRKRSLGNIRFIGELFKLQMLSETIMHECITRLLKSTSDEESLECFARLITTTGKDLDKEQAKGRMDAYFKRIIDIIQKGKVPARVRSMLQDVLELRDNSWVPRFRQEWQLKAIDQPRRMQKPPKKIIRYQPLNQEVVLHKAENPWMPMVKGDMGVGSAKEAQAAELYHKFQGILNKLTPQKFQALAEQALKLEINTEERLSRCIDKVYSNVLAGPKYSIVYANLCKVMSPIKVEYQSEDGKAKQTNFRRMLLTKCQKEFEKDKKDDESIKLLEKEIERAETEEERAALKEKMEFAFTKMRKRSLANIQFIGELFKLQMLSEIIMHGCITRLLKSMSDEESLECFARLITTTGKDLDKEQVKGHMDVYFKRITDIIKKGMICPRVRFMLQDVLELRENSWVPRVRQDQQLKTIDQIHAEAAIEEAKEKEIIQHHQVSMKGAAGGRDSRRGSKDDFLIKDRGHYRGERETFEHNKLISSNRKDNGSGGQGYLGPQAVLRPGWKKNGPSTQTSEGSKLEGKAVSRSATNPRSKSRTDTCTGSKGQSSMPGPRRSHMTPESERESMLQTVTEFSSKPSEAVPSAPASHAPSRDAPAQAILCSDKRPSAPTPISEEAIASVQRKVTSTIDELVLNKDYKEAIECVKKIDLPGAMRQVVVEGINHTLERKAVFRTVTGELFSRLVQEKVITQQDFSHGLNEVLEGAEDMCIDIPKIWDYLGEVLAPVFAQEIISLSILRNPPASLLVSGRAAVLVAKVLCQCVSVLKGEEEVKRLWARCGLTWDDLGKPKENVEEFLDRKNLSFLLVQNTAATKELPPTLLENLRAQLMSPETTNEDINVWIKSNCSEQEYDPAVLVSNVTSVVVQASVSGSRDQAVFNQDFFERRIEVVKGQGHHGLAVLHGLQCSVAKLSHPPKLFHNLLNMAFDTDLFEEQDFYNWLDDELIMYGKGTAVALAKPFLDWLKADGGYKF